MISIGETRAKNIVNAIGECMSRANLSEQEQIEVLDELLQQLNAVRSHVAAQRGPSDDKETEDDE